MIRLYELERSAIDDNEAKSDAVQGERYVPAVVTAMRILDYLASHDGASGTAVRQALELNASTCHNTLKTLARGGYLSFDEASKQYRLGPSLVAAGVKAYSEESLLATARPALRKWVQDTSFTAFVAKPLPDWSSVIVDKIESTRRIKVTVEVGQRFPADAAVIGKIFLAHLDVDELDIVRVELGRYTENTIHDIHAWRDELARVRELGWSESRGEYYGGGNAVAAPIFDPLGKVVAVVGSLAASSDLADSQLADFGRSIKATAATISDRLRADT
jgi:DNA-binding IclR family transcriptional regulator